LGENGVKAFVDTLSNPASRSVRDIRLSLYHSLDVAQRKAKRIHLTPDPVLAEKPEILQEKAGGPEILEGLLW
jgi:hypothetical protein